MSGNNLSISEKAKLAYHSNEEEFNQNLLNFLMNPLPVALCRDTFKITERMVTPEGFKPIIYVEDYSVYESCWHESEQDSNL